MKFIKESVIRASPERVFAFHEQADVLSLLIPPGESAKVIKPAKISEVNSEAIIETRIFGPLKTRWVARHTVYDPPRLFEDIQVEGPFRSWRHQHVIERHTDGAILHDEIDYEPPFGFLGRLLAPLLVEKRLRRVFDYRHEVTRDWCERKGSGQ